MPLRMIPAASVPLMKGKPPFLTPRLYSSVLIEHVFFSLERSDRFQNPNRSLVVKTCILLGLTIAPLRSLLC